MTISCFWWMKKKRKSLFLTKFFRILLRFSKKCIPPFESKISGANPFDWPHTHTSCDCVHALAHCTSCCTRTCSLVWAKPKGWKLLIWQFLRKVHPNWVLGAKRTHRRWWEHTAGVRTCAHVCMCTPPEGWFHEPRSEAESECVTTEAKRGHEKHNRTLTPAHTCDRVKIVRAESAPRKRKTNRAMRMHRRCIR